MLLKCKIREKLMNKSNYKDSLVVSTEQALPTTVINIAFYCIGGAWYKNKKPKVTSCVSGTYHSA